MTQLSAYVGAVLNYLTIGVVLFGGLFGDLTPSDVSVLISQVGCARGVWAFIVVVSFTVDFFCCPFSIPLFCYTAVVPSCGLRNSGLFSQPGMRHLYLTFCSTRLISIQSFSSKNKGRACIISEIFEKNLVKRLEYATAFCSR